MNTTTTTPSSTSSRWRTSKSLARSAWHVLKIDKTLAGLPVVSTISAIVVAILVGVVVFSTSTYQTNPDGVTITGPLLETSWLSLLFYISVYLLFTCVATYFNAALIAGLLQRFKGQKPTVGSSLATANEHFVPVLQFGVLTGTIGFILQAIEERSAIAGKAVTWLIGGAWAIASMFALPVIVDSKEKVGPFKATRQSLEIIKKTWGETAILNVGIGIVAIVSVLAFVFTMMAVGVLTTTIANSLQVSNLVFGVSIGVVGVVGILGLIGLSLLFTMLSAIIKAAIYHYATTGESPEGFEQELIRTSFTPKKARGIFS